MTMPTTDYHQQLLWYLQTWRQLLEQWAAMAAGAPFLTASPMPPAPPMQFMPFIPPFAPPFGLPVPPAAPVSPVPFGPPAPPAPQPPAPGDYAQQLFSYLQAWRQYLEQAASAGTPRTGSVEQSAVQQSAARPANDGGTTGRPDLPVPPTDPPGGISALQSDEHKKSDPTPPPKLVDRAPNHFHQSQLAAIDLEPAASPFDDPGERFQMPDPVTLSARPEAAHRIVEAVPHPNVGSAFVSAMQRVGPVASPPAAPVSLFSTPDVSASVREAGETPSR